MCSLLFVVVVVGGAVVKRIALLGLVKGFWGVILEPQRDEGMHEGTQRGVVVVVVIVVVWVRLLKESLRSGVFGFVFLCLVFCVSSLCVFAWNFFCLQNHPMPSET